MVCATVRVGLCTMRFVVNQLGYGVLSTDRTRHVCQRTNQSAMKARAYDLTVVIDIPRAPSWARFLAAFS